jgi:hypothetical protein
MKRLVEGVDRSQITLCPERLDDWIDGDPMLIICFCQRSRSQGAGL